MSIFSQEIDPYSRAETILRNQGTSSLMVFKGYFIDRNPALKSEAETLIRDLELDQRDERFSQLVTKIAGKSNSAVLRNVLSDVSLPKIPSRTAPISRPTENSSRSPSEEEFWETRPSLPVVKSPPLVRDRSASVNERIKISYCGDPDLYREVGIPLSIQISARGSSEALILLQLPSKEWKVELAASQPPRGWTLLEITPPDSRRRYLCHYNPEGILQIIDSGSLHGV